VQGVRSAGFPPYDHDSHTCWVERLKGAEAVRSSLEKALDHDVLRLRLAVAEEARSAGRPCSRDHSPTVKTAQIAAPTGQMIRANPHEIKEFEPKNRVKLQLVHSASLYQEHPPRQARGNHVQENCEPAWLRRFERCTTFAGRLLRERPTRLRGANSVQGNRRFYNQKPMRKRPGPTTAPARGGRRASIRAREDGEASRGFSGSSSADGDAATAVGLA
jgi:hypothetical protein